MNSPIPINIIIGFPVKTRIMLSMNSPMNSCHTLFSTFIVFLSSFFVFVLVLLFYFFCYLYFICFSLT